MEMYKTGELANEAITLLNNFANSIGITLDGDLVWNESDDTTSCIYQLESDELNGDIPFEKFQRLHVYCKLLEDNKFIDSFIISTYNYQIEIVYNGGFE